MRPHSSRFVLLDRRAISICIALILALAITAPALAEYLGPDRVTSVFKEVHVPEKDVWTLTNSNPPDGYLPVCLIIHPCSEHPSTDRQELHCGWIAENSGCTEWWEEQEVTITLPEATIGADLQNCSPVDGWCTNDPTLVLTGSEPVDGESITLIEGTRNGELFACEGANCSVPLLQGQNDFSFWAHSSWGDTSQMGSLSAAVDSEGPLIGIPDAWYIWEPLSIAVDDSHGIETVKLSIHGGEYGSRQYQWNLPNLPGGFIWDRYFGEIVAPIGEYPVTVTAIDGLGNSSKEYGTILIPAPEPEDSDELATLIEGEGATASEEQPADGLDGSSGSGPADAESGAAGTESESTGQQTEPTDSASQLPDPASLAAAKQDKAGSAVATTTGGGNPVLWGAAAAAAIGAATAYGLNRKRQREAAIEAKRKQLAQRQSERSFADHLDNLRQAAWTRIRPAYEQSRRLAAAAAAATAAAATRARNLYENLTTRLPRLLPEGDLPTGPTARARQLMHNLTSRLPRLLPEGDLPGSQQTSSPPEAEASSSSFNMAQWKQQDMAAADAAAEAQRQQAYQEFRQQERMAASVPPVPVVAEPSWWERAVDTAKETVNNVVDWVDQHQTGVSLGVGLLAGAAGVAAIVLSGGTATPLVVAGWAALAAGTTVAAGTVALNAHYGRALGDNLLRNVGASMAGAAAPVFGHWLLTGGASSVLLTAGNTVLSACARFPTACATAGPVLGALDTIEEISLSVQLAVQTATKDPRAPETAIELQLERMDGGLPGNTFIREAREELSEIAGRHGDDAVRKLALLREEILDVATRQGDGSLSAILGWDPDNIARYGSELAERAPKDARALGALERLMDLDDLASSEASELIELIAENSIQGSGDRFVLGRWISHADGYVNEGRLDGGRWYETHPEIYQRLVQRFDRTDERIQNILWEINEAAIQRGIAQGLEFESSFTRMTPAEYGRESAAIRLYIEGDLDEARRILAVPEGNLPARLRELTLLLRAGYSPVFDDAAQLIRWSGP